MQNGMPLRSTLVVGAHQRRPPAVREHSGRCIQPRTCVAQSNMHRLQLHMSAANASARRAGRPGAGREHLTASGLGSWFSEARRESPPCLVTGRRDRCAGVEAENAADAHRACAMPPETGRRVELMALCMRAGRSHISLHLGTPG